MTVEEKCLVTEHLLNECLANGIYQKRCNLAKHFPDILNVCFIWKALAFDLLIAFKGMSFYTLRQIKLAVPVEIMNSVHLKTSHRAQVDPIL